MKAPHWFTLAIILSLGILFVVEYNQPKKFVWYPTFAHRDYQPFGCAIFDDVLTASSAGSYSLTKETFFQMTLHPDSVPPPALLAIAQNINLIEADCNALLELADAGSRVMLVASAFNHRLCDTLGFEHSYEYFRISEIKKYASRLQPRDSLLWIGSPGASASPELFTCYPQLCNVFLIPKDSLFVPLATVQIDSSQMRAYNSLSTCSPPVAMRRSVGKGEIILVSTPLLFTNYGMLDGRNSEYLFRLLSLLGGRPIVRTEAYSTSAQEQQSPLSYFLTQPALRWALYLTMAVILLFMIFNARRRQRAIPVVSPPQNRTLEFTALIGTLYYQRHQHLDLLRKKFTYFAETLRRTIQVDVEETTNDPLLARRIASKTGGDEAEILSLLRKLRPLTGDAEAKGELSEEEMKQLIDRMNKISRQT